MVALKTLWNKCCNIKADGKFLADTFTKKVNLCISNLYLMLIFYENFCTAVSIHKHNTRVL